MSAQPKMPLSIEQIVGIKTPESPAWSPDCARLAFRMAGFEHGEIWVSEHGSRAEQLTEGDAAAGPPVWNGDETLLFNRGTSIRSISIGGDDEELVLELPNSATRVTILPSADAAIYALDGDAWLHEFDKPEPTRMTEGQWIMTRLVHRITDVFFPSPDGQHIAIALPREHSLDLAVFSRENDTLHEIVPRNDSETLTSFGSESATPRGTASGDSVETAAIWSPDGSRLAFTRYDWRVKWRELWVSDPLGNDPFRIWRDESQKWVSRFQFEAAFSPHGNYIAFVAPIGNFGQVLVGHADNSSQAVQISEPEAEAEKPRWSPDGNWIAYLSNQDRERHLHINNALHRDDRHNPIQQSCFVADYAWAPDSERLAVISSDPYLPDQLMIADRQPGKFWTVSPDAGRYIGTVSDIQISAATIPSDDGKWEIPILMMQRRNLPRDKSAPGIVYIHGGGQGQYAVAGWQGYSGAGTTYAANMMLAQMGYVVLIVDYRGSWNYGRSYETAPYLDVGGGDLRDVITATRWLGDQSRVDPDRIGVWGRSYGGFMTTLCMTKEPEFYAAGVNLVGVFNWVDYYHYLSDRAPGVWSRSRFELPEEHPELYRERNPLEYIEELSAPYLALYGNDDANVPIDHCWQMVRALTDHAKDFELVVYPDEPHIFTRAATWYDALRRTVRHFNEHLR